MNKIELFENQRASGYNQFVETWIPNYHYFMNNLPNLLKQTENKNLLVVGCGTGNEIERFVHTTEQWKITGIDPSPEMISQAVQNLKDFKNVNLIEGIVNDLDRSDKFGAATLLLVLHFMEDDGTKLNLLKNIAERLEFGAPLILLDITGNKTQIKENLEVLRLFLPKNLDKDDINNRLHRIENELNAVSEERLSQLLIEAGFEAPLRFFQTSIYMGWMTRKK
ncbi:class I SAM-dependent methyltransferase [Galbibacter sp. EGI 63066]|uniref:class I SAM-dependent methyltransferase n=1 Tax=Galbibacter sp. EGI 63066 TaxID=2993559 RepID=UPI0022498E39|nr:class I SAM-dependent methyltransferase [Galbibacter sp. EGI 63066]MCX2681315.1 class I SAM-dependent methyltransferase [Galbibacter sp. EGI 63066]